jgi:hypothetical protein
MYVKVASPIFPTNVNVLSSPVLLIFHTSREILHSANQTAFFEGGHGHVQKFFYTKNLDNGFVFPYN